MTLSDRRAEMEAGKFGVDGPVWRKEMVDRARADSVAELAQ